VDTGTGRDLGKIKNRPEVVTCAEGQWVGDTRSSKRTIRGKGG